MKKIIFILGGARSGKSSYAVKLAKKLKQRTLFIATARPVDEEMEKRIKLHKSSRPRQWKLIEEDKNINRILSNLKNKYKVILIDCLGMLIFNFLADNLGDKNIEKRLKVLLRTALNLKAVTILVSNEVGSGIVPDNHLARHFRDLLGLTNQICARKADEVIFMQSGIPLIIKKEKINAEIK